MATKKKKPKNSNTYWMKFGGAPSDMKIPAYRNYNQNIPKADFGMSEIPTRGGSEAVGGPGFWEDGGDWTGGREDITEYGLQHLLTGKPITPWYPQYESGHQRGRSNPEREWDYAYENGGDPDWWTENEESLRTSSALGIPDWWTKNEESLRTSSALSIPGSDKSDDPLTDPTFKTWFAKNARRKDVMEASSNPEVLKSLFLSDVGRIAGGMYTDNTVQMDELPLFSNEIDDFGNVDKSGRSLGLSSKIIGGLEKRYGGTPKARYGIEEDDYDPDELHSSSLPNFNIYDRNTNLGTATGAVGDTNIAQAFGPYGRIVDALFDTIGFLGTQKQISTSLKDARKAKGDLTLYDDPDALKQTLDMSTRTGSLKALANYKDPGINFMNTLAPEYAQNVGGYLASGAIKGGGTGTGTGTGEIGDAINPAGAGVVVGRYGGVPKAKSGLASIRKRPGMGNAGKYPNVKDFAGPHGTYPINSIDRGRSALKLAHHSNNPDAIKSKVYAKYPSLKAAHGGKFGSEDQIQKGRQEFESGMDLRDLARAAYGGVQKGKQELESGMDLRNYNRAAYGGAMELGPGYVQNSPNLNPSEEFKSQGVAQKNLMYAFGGEGAEEYEAEDGEVIVHDQAQTPGTTGELETLASGVSKMHGKSHEQTDAQGNTGEKVDSNVDQYVFSDSLKSEQWKTTFAKAAEKIASNITKYEKLFREGDEITKSTAQSMIQVWQGKLSELKNEQEKSRQEKFIALVESGASEEELYQNFPDLTEQFLSQQQAEEQLVNDPMGQGDLAQLTEGPIEMPEQPPMGGEGDLPQAQYGYDPEKAFKFSDWFADLELGSINDDKFLSYTGDVNRRGMPSRKDFLSNILPYVGKEGITYGDETIEPNEDFYNQLMERYTSERSAFRTDEGIPSSKPSKSDFYKDTLKGNVSKDVFQSEDYEKQLALYNLYGSNLPTDWEEKYGESSGIGKRRYWKSRHSSLMAEEGMTSDRAARIVQQEQNIYNENQDLLKQTRKDQIKKGNFANLTEEEQLQQLIQDQIENKESSEQWKRLGNALLTGAPSLYNLFKSQEGPEHEPFYGNKYENEILQNLETLKSTDIRPMLENNKEIFDKYKYLASSHSDGSSVGYANTLLKGMSTQLGADRAALQYKEDKDIAGTQLSNEALFKLGEKGRDEGIRQGGINAENRAMVQQFEAKFWEGLSGIAQLDQKTQNQIKNDEMLRGLLDDIYPDAHLYINDNGEIDWDALLKEHPELSEMIEKYRKNK